MAQHVIPESEPDLHQESPDCPCEPEFKLDEESGEMVWIHKISDLDRLLDGFVKIDD